jgi:hypothetical protein
MLCVSSAVHLFCAPNSAHEQEGRQQWLVNAQVLDACHSVAQSNYKVAQLIGALVIHNVLQQAAAVCSSAPVLATALFEPLRVLKRLLLIDLLCLCIVCKASYEHCQDAHMYANTTAKRDGALRKQQYVVYE